MQRFDCLSLDCPLFGPHLLEASAGTGKTFSIEHIFVRFILQGIDLEKILAVTFTRAATRELKGRIRSNLETALEQIEAGESSWGYLEPYLNNEEAIRKIADALACFDRAQIFTIHSFCHRLLNEFAFEAKIGKMENVERVTLPAALIKGAFDFLENGISPKDLCTEQISLLLKQFDSVEKIVERLVKMDEVTPSMTYQTQLSECKAALHSWHLSEEKLLEDFYALEKGYKVAVRGDFQKQIKALVHESNFAFLLKERGSIFEFFSHENKKVKFNPPQHLNYPGFFEWGRGALLPILKAPVFPILQKLWNPIGKKILSEEEFDGPDAIILKMRRCLEDVKLLSLMQQKYGVAIIDEFQDTDALQWEIFQKLFVEKPIYALYLVGDPKQSIYRFRKADVYTYLKARDFLGEAHLYHLDTNFRSSKKMIGALNALFSRNWQHLPKLNRTLPFHPVLAGAKIEHIDDGKGAVHFFEAEGEPAALFDELFLPYVAAEIERLEMGSMAILVKDRFQAEKTLLFLKNRAIRAVCKSHTPLGKTAAFEDIVELFEAIFNPRDLNLQAIVLQGPFAKAVQRLFEFRQILEERGVVFLAKELLLDADGMQIFELLFQWELREGFSFEGLKRELQRLEELKADEGGARFVEVDESAVQIMTIHVSKGLEFDVVFALGLASRTPVADDIEEIDAEKLRLQYVAMTRAKKRLYIPLVGSKKDPEGGTHSPLELFARYFEKGLLDEMKALSSIESITVEKVHLPILFNPRQKIEKAVSEPKVLPKNYSPLFISSFTTLAKKISELKVAVSEEGVTIQTMPRGAETGVLIHKIFEKIFGVNLDLEEAVGSTIEWSSLIGWKEPIMAMVKQTLSLELKSKEGSFTLLDIEKALVEVEFLYPTPNGFIKGFIDLVFFYRNRVYFVDWKTNWLLNYSPESVANEMNMHDYYLQASIYKEALQREFKMEFGGAYYIFVRGGGVCSM